MPEITSDSPETTRQLGCKLGALLQPGDLLCLQGDLGAGKTTFVQGLAAGWGSRDEVSSPTFVLVNVYRGRNGGQLYHLDTYRIESTAEAEELDFDSMLAQGPLLIEWAERVKTVLPGENLWVRMEYIDENARRLSLTACGARYQALLEKLRA